MDRFFDMCHYLQVFRSVNPPVIDKVAVPEPTLPSLHACSRRRGLQRRDLCWQQSKQQSHGGPASCTLDQRTLHVLVSFGKYKVSLNTVSILQ